MGWKKNTPGCNASGSCGCATCSICTGDGCGFFVDTGTADLTVPGQITTTSNPSRVLTTAEDTSGGTAAQASVDFTSTTNGEILRLILKYKDSSNYWWAQVQAGTSGTISLRKRVAGTDTTLASSSIVNPVGTTYTLTFCYGNGGVSAALLVGTTVITQIAATATTTITDGPKAGVAQASATTGTVFTNFVYEYGFQTTLHEPCDNCYRDCQFHDDNFNRADSSSLGSNWTVVSGTWSITSNQLQTSSPSAIVINTNVPTLGTQGMAVRCSTVDYIRIILGYVDTDNYYYHECVPKGGGDNYSRIVQRSGGVETVLQEVIGNEGGRMFCYEPQYSRLVAGNGNGSSTHIIANDISPITSTVCGIGTAPGLTGTGIFDDFDVEYVGPGTTCQLCDNCSSCDGQNRNLPDIQVVISGLTNNTCGSCTSINGTYILQHIGQLTPGICYWRYIFPSTKCGMKYLTAFMGSSANTWTVILQDTHINTAPLSHRMTWDATGQPENCTSGTYAGSWNSSGGFLIGTDCSGGSSTATITIPA